MLQGSGLLEVLSWWHPVLVLSPLMRKLIKTLIETLGEQVTGVGQDHRYTYIVT